MKLTGVFLSCIFLTHVVSTHSLIKVVKICTVDEFYDLHDLARDFNVRCTVIDYKPEIRKVREFQRAENHRVFACDYVERKTGQASWDEKDGFVKVNRTEICDATHELVVNPGRLQLPRRCKEMEDYVKEMCNIVKILEEDEITGAKEYRYRGLGSGRPDHYRHATNYMLLASNRVGVASDRSFVSSYLNRRKRRGGWMAA